MVAAFDICPVCGKERKLERQARRSDAWVFTEHRRWTGTEMIRCAGSGRPPGRKNPGKIIFRQP